MRRSTSHCDGQVKTDYGWRSFLLSFFLSLPISLYIGLIPLLQNKVSPPADHTGFLLTVTPFDDGDEQWRGKEWGGGKRRRKRCAAWGEKSERDKWWWIKERRSENNSGKIEDKSHRGGLYVPKSSQQSGERTWRLNGNVTQSIHPPICPSLYPLHTQ